MHNNITRLLKVILLIIPVFWFVPAKGAVDQLIELKEIVKKAAEAAESIDSSTPEGRHRQIDALREVSTIEAKINRNRAEESFKNLIEKVEGMDIHPLTEKLQEQFQAKNPRQASSKAERLEQNRRHLAREKATTLKEIAIAQAQSGFIQAASQTFGRAIQLAEELPADLSFQGRDWILADIAKAQIKSGDLEGAKTTFHKVMKSAEASEDEDKADQTISVKLKSAYAYIELGDRVAAKKALREALQEVPKLADPWGRSGTLFALAAAQFRMSDGDAAMKTLREGIDLRVSLTGKVTNDVPLHNITDVLKIAQMIAMEGGNPSDIERLIQMAVDMVKGLDEGRPLSAKIKSEAWRKVAMVRALMGDLKGALEANAKVTDPSHKKQALLFIAEAQIKSGDFKEALEIAIALRDQQLLSSIATAQANSGQISEALITVNGITKDDVALRAPALRAIAKARVHTELDKENVLIWAQNRESPLEKVYALLGVIEGSLS